MRKQLLIQFLLPAVLITACSNNKTAVKTSAELKPNDASLSSVVVAQTQPNGDQVVSTTPVSAKSWESPPKMSWSGTTLVEMHDGFGNKVENRSFPKHSQITMVIVRTPAKGEQSIEIYGRNGELRKLPADRINLALQGTDDEIAAVAGIANTKVTITSESKNVSQTESQSSIQKSTQNSDSSLNNSLNKEQPQTDLNYNEPRTTTTSVQPNPNGNAEIAN